MHPSLLLLPHVQAGRGAGGERDSESSFPTGGIKIAQTIESAKGPRGASSTPHPQSESLLLHSPGAARPQPVRGRVHHPPGPTGSGGLLGRGKQKQNKADPPASPSAPLLRFLCPQPTASPAAPAWFLGPGPPPASHFWLLPPPPLSEGGATRWPRRGSAPRPYPTHRVRKGDADWPGQKLGEESGPFPASWTSGLRHWVGTF